MLFIKHLIKKYFWGLAFYKKMYSQSRKSNHLFVAALDKSSFFSQEKLNIFTTHDEDGILLNIFQKIGTLSKRFIDIGSNDGINSNCANLAFHFGWNGVFIDGNRSVLKRGMYIYKKRFGSGLNNFIFKHALVTPQNVDDILLGFIPPHEIDLLSIDLDGNDYFIWEKITAINPRVVVTEVQIEKHDVDFIPDYTVEFELYESDVPKGASALAMINLARVKGYTLVAANKEGFNLFFVRNDSLNSLKELTLQELFLPIL